MAISISKLTSWLIGQQKVFPWLHWLPPMAPAARTGIFKLLNAQLPPRMLLRSPSDAELVSQHEAAVPLEHDTTPLLMMVPVGMTAVTVVVTGGSSTRITVVGTAW